MPLEKLYPTYQVRLGHKDRLRFRQFGHGRREDLPPERVGTLAEPYLHYSFSKGLTDWFDKHNRYASDEARETVAAVGGTRGLGAYRIPYVSCSRAVRQSWARCSASSIAPSPAV
jgi:hypothetical protein